jgi:hypothetical protein
MEYYILDTNVFFNMQAGFQLGQTTDEVITSITHIAAEGKKSKEVELLMPPRIVEEFLSFFDNPHQPAIQKMLSLITVKSPDAHQGSVATQLFYTLIQDVRDRSYRGLRIGEEEIEAAGKSLMEVGTLSRMEFQKKVGTQIKGFRERYRQATRVGFLDSVGDLDIIMLAKEVNGTVVSSDEGLLKWSRLFGVKEVPASAFRPLHQE